MDYKEKLEKYFITLGLTFENLGESAWVINDTEKGLENVMVLVRRASSHHPCQPDESPEKKS
jgi:hypothetical protein